MAESGRVDKFPQNIIGDQRLPLRVVIDERPNMLLQEIGGNRHLNLLFHSGTVAGRGRAFIM